MLHFTVPPLWLCVLAVVLSATGCGSGLIVAEGQITKGGEPFKSAKDETLRVVFGPYIEGKPPDDSITAEVDQENGTFLVRGIDRRGIEPGKYRIGVELLNDYDRDKWKGKFRPAKSPIIRDVTGDYITIDLDKPEG